MITNDYQYRLTKAAADKFRAALAEIKRAPRARRTSTLAF